MSTVEWGPRIIRHRHHRVVGRSRTVSLTPPAATPARAQSSRRARVGSARASTSAGATRRRRVSTGGNLGCLPDVGKSGGSRLSESRADERAEAAADGQPGRGEPHTEPLRLRRVEEDREHAAAVVRQLGAVVVRGTLTRNEGATQKGACNGANGVREATAAGACACACTARVAHTSSRSTWCMGSVSVGNVCSGSSTYSAALDSSSTCTPPPRPEVTSRDVTGDASTWHQYDSWGGSTCWTGTGRGFDQPGSGTSAGKRGGRGMGRAHGREWGAQAGIRRQACSA